MASTQVIDPHGHASSQVAQHFPKFSLLPSEVKQLIWEFAARPLHPTGGNVHYVSLCFNRDKRRRHLTRRRQETTQEWLLRGGFGLQPLMKAPYDWGLWQACKGSRDAMCRRFRTPEWAAQLRSERHEPKAEHVAFGQTFRSVSAAAGRGQILLRREDLVVFKQVAVPVASDRVIKFCPDSKYYNEHKMGLGYFRDFPARMLCSPPAIRSGAAHVAFPLEELLVLGDPTDPFEPQGVWGPEDPSWRSAVEGMAAAFVRRIIRLRDLGDALPTQQLWVVDDALRVPRGFVVPEGRHIFVGDGFRLVEVELEDYGVDAYDLDVMFFEADQEALWAWDRPKVIGCDERTSLRKEVQRCLDEMKVFKVQEDRMVDFGDMLNVAENKGYRLQDFLPPRLENLVNYMKVLAYEPLGRNDPTTKTGEGFRDMMDRLRRSEDPMFRKFVFQDAEDAED